MLRCLVVVRIGKYIFDSYVSFSQAKTKYRVSKPALFLASCMKITYIISRSLKPFETGFFIVENLSRKTAPYQGSFI